MTLNKSGVRKWKDRLIWKYRMPWNTKQNTRKHKKATAEPWPRARQIQLNQRAIIQQYIA